MNKYRHREIQNLSLGFHNHWSGRASIHFQAVCPRGQVLNHNAVGFNNNIYQL